MGNTNQNSNAAARRWAIGKAVLLVFIPMAFAAMGTALISKTNKVDSSKITLLKNKLTAIEHDRKLFLEEMAEIGLEWAKYQKLQQQAIVAQDSLSSGSFASQIEQQEKQLKEALTRLETSFKVDTTFGLVYSGAIQQYKQMVTNYSVWAKDKVRLRECRSGLGGEAELLQRVDDLDKENFQLKLQVLNCDKEGSETKGLEREIRQWERKLDKCESDKEKLAKDLSFWKNKEADLAVGANTIFSDTKRKLEKLKVDGLCIGCNKKEVNRKVDGIIEEMQRSMRELLKP